MKDEKEQRPIDTYDDTVDFAIDREHHLLVEALVKQGIDIMHSLTPGKCDLIHMTLKIPSEAGELADAIARYVIYENSLDRENVIEELGDLEYHLRHFRTLLGISRDETLRHNIKKLRERYPEGTYSNRAAIERADKKEGG